MNYLKDKEKDVIETQIGIGGDAHEDGHWYIPLTCSANLCAISFSSYCSHVRDYCRSCDLVYDKLFHPKTK